MLSEQNQRINEQILGDLHEESEKAPAYLSPEEQHTFLEMKKHMDAITENKDMFAKIDRQKKIKDFDYKLSKKGNTNSFALWHVLMGMTLPNKKLVLDTPDHMIENFIKDLK